MAINRYRYYLGPLGLLQPLPGHPMGGEVSAPSRFSAAEHVSLSGRTTQDRLGRVRRAWSLSWAWLDEDQELYIQAAARMQHTDQLRLMDPRKRNLAPEDISVGGSATKSVKAFTETGTGAIAWGSGGVPVELLGVTGGRVVWTGAANTSVLTGVTEKTPMIAGSTYRVSAFVKTTTTFKFIARPFDLLGAEQTTVQDGTNNASTAGVWLRKSWLYTPAAGICSAYFGFLATGSGNIETSGWSYQIDDTLKNWTFGYGCPTVTVANEVPNTYFRTKYANTGLALQEV